MTQSIMGTGRGGSGSVEISISRRAQEVVRLGGGKNPATRVRPGGIGQCPEWGRQGREVREQRGSKVKGLASRNCCLPLNLFQELVSVQSPGEARADQPLGRVLQKEMAISCAQACFKTFDPACTSSTVTSAQRQNSLISSHMDGSVGMCA